jgi:putative methanogenesis marker protein 8
MKMLGKTKIKVKDEKVWDVGEPRIKYCPLFDKIRAIKDVTSKVAAGNMVFRIKKHGMFSPRRKLDMGIFVGFGVSETITTGIENGLIDAAAVTVCDGAGTVITSNPYLVQGMGGYISDMVETDPIPEVIEGIAIRKIQTIL